MAFDQSSGIIRRDQAAFLDHLLMRRRRSHCRRRMVFPSEQFPIKIARIVSSGPLDSAGNFGDAD